MKSQRFPWLPIMQFRRMAVFGDSNEQIGTHQKLSPTSTIYVNCMNMTLHVRVPECPVLVGVTLNLTSGTSPILLAVGIPNLVCGYILGL